MCVWRPCDSREAAVAWRYAIERTEGPTALLFTRQAVVHRAANSQRTEDIARGGYVRVDCDGTPEAIIIATGSEVPLAEEASQQLANRGRRVRVVSMPSTHVFDAQDAGYRESILPRGITARVAIEAGLTEGWLRYVGAGGTVIGIDCFGESAPFGVAFKHFGFTVDNAVKRVEQVLAAQRA